MTVFDKQGRPYARRAELKPGTVVIVDADFGGPDGCMKPWSEKIVNQSDDEFWIPCKSGRHYLDGQLTDDNDSLIRIYLKEGFIR